ncbi:TetR/AcrR family transcriptional regulator [Nocardioides mangrovicus]|uniref:TetR/AcrR family transcriptional regulator n=1 Tax=Nocardioides mangrovicus TaxID=2478913 RepID=A0A3L8P2H7_9ACTN|nr:TetR/AcrR family transcriptional regulator [Nocardioides mangrovicus]RLV49261.1 TetR/AcrR family transcriptional regulator [Nocardioides mangrovicus]
MSTPASTDRRRSAALARRRKREQEILAATRALFDERGVRDAQIEDVARAVGVNRAIIYRHFTGKEELFALTLVGYLDDLHSRLTGTASGVEDGDPVSRVRAITEAFVDFGLEFPAFVDCAQTLMRRPGPELLEEISESALFRLGRGIAGCLSVLSAALRAGVDAGEFAIDDVDLVANTLYATGLGALQLARVGMLVKEAAPGVPMVAPLSAQQVKDHLVRSALALAR